MAFPVKKITSLIWSQWLKHVDIPLGINAGMHQEFLHHYQSINGAYFFNTACKI